MSRIIMFTRLVSDRYLNINDAYKLIKESSIRDSQIVEDVKTCIKDCRSPLVLSRFRDHSLKLYK